MSVSTTHRIPFRDGETWAQVFSAERPTPGALPLVVLHGGPGMAHNYLSNLSALTATGRDVILYDLAGEGDAEAVPATGERGAL